MYRLGSFLLGGCDPRGKGCGDGREGQEEEEVSRSHVVVPLAALTHGSRAARRGIASPSRFQACAHYTAHLMFAAPSHTCV